MGLYLMAAAMSVGDVVGMLQTVLMVALGLGAVIFVHELGHFMVAKACGVQCDKFYIGFDIYGLKLWKKQWGETEYGIGILPLGGYVKMLGQDDNPAKAAEEMRRAKLAQEGTSEAGEPDGETKYVLNPRSYLAKSVPQRMAIISAGVIMNIIFAFIFATIAYRWGVPYEPSIVDGVIPGSPAWQVPLRAGDNIVQIDNNRHPEFTDLRSSVTLGDLDNGVSMIVERPGVTEEIPLVIKPDRKTALPTIGMRPARSLRVGGILEAYKEYLGELQVGDEIVEVDGKPIRSSAALQRALAANVKEPLKVTVLRGSTRSETNIPGAATGGELVEIVIPPVPMRRLGLEMRIGQIVAVQADSPAAKAGLKPEDFIEKIDGQLISEFDPITLPDELRAKALEGSDVTLVISRKSAKGESQTEEITIPLRVPDWLESSATMTAPQSAPALGIAYRVLNKVQQVAPNSSAEKAGIAQGDQVVKVEFIPSDDDTSEWANAVREANKKKPLEFGEGKEDGWPGLVENVQSLPPGTLIKLTVVKSAAKEKFEEYVLEPMASAEDFNPERGLLISLEPLQYVRRADGWGEAARLGLWRTKDSLLMVYRFLQKIGRQVPATAMGGPVTIFQAAGSQAAKGVPSLLIFLTVLSANLAVINFLPIPVLDGGHMVFLIYEGVMRRPVSERIQVAMQFVGLAFILGLMTFVISLDLGWISRGF